MVAEGSIAIDNSANIAHKEWNRKAKNYNFDKDIHIVNPESHFRILDLLANHVY